jgi:hypothetical protein
MGSAYKQTGYPHQCAEPLALEMLHRSSSDVNSEDPVLRKVAALIDYDKATEGRKYVIVRMSQFQYKRAKSLNICTREDKDKLTVVRDDGDGTALLIGVDSRSKAYIAVEAFEGSFCRFRR